MSGPVLQGLEPLFFSPLLQFDLPDATRLNARLLQEVHARRAASAGLSRSNIDGWHSEDDFFAREEPGHKALSAQVLEAVRQATMQVSPQFDFSRVAMQAEGWVNVLGRGGMNAPHDHPAWVWSGCYYVQVPIAEDDGERSGQIEFLDSRTNVRTLTVEGAACFASKFTLQPRTGQLLVFPSYLKHWVSPNRSDEERVSVAFNLRFARRP